MTAPHAQRFIDALHRLEAQNDPEALLSLFADEAELSNPTDTKPHQGPGGARRFWDAYRNSFQEISSEFRNVVASEDVAMLEWTSQGTMAEGGPIRYDGVSVLEFGGGKVQRFRAYFDPAALQAQMSRHGA